MASGIQFFVERGYGVFRLIAIVHCGIYNVSSGLLHLQEQFFKIVRLNPVIGVKGGHQSVGGVEDGVASRLICAACGSRQRMECYSRVGVGIMLCNFSSAVG